jgi:integrase/recombinase XerD
MLELEPFLEDLQLRGMSKWTLGRHKYSLNGYSNWAYRCKRTDLYSQDAILGYLAYLRDKDMRLNSIKSIFNCLNSYYDFLENKGQIQKNPIPAIKKRYLRAYKDQIRQRKLLSLEETTRMIRSTIDSRDRAILTLLLKTGIRRSELISLDLSDVDMKDLSATLKPTGKRTNRTVFFDEETARALSRWMQVRAEKPHIHDRKALFLNCRGSRFSPSGLDKVARDASMRMGLDESAKPGEINFSPHACRHWFTTYLLRAGMKREYVQWLRGDAIKEAVDIYFHIDPKDVQEAYLSCIPQLGI